MSLFDFDSTIVPDIDFCVKDASIVEADTITNYEKYYYLITKIRKTLTRGDPVRLFFMSIIYQLVVQRSIVDSTGKENLLKYSHGDNLVNIGAKWGKRGLPLDGAYATTTIRFTLAAPVTATVPVPIGTLVQTGNKNRFATTQDGVIQVGQTSIDLSAKALVEGVSENDFIPGQVNQLVSWSSPFLVSAVNITITSGGANKESDEHLRARIWMAPESFSVAGPYGAYEFFAASANPDIMDVSVWSDIEHAGQVYVYPLMVGGRLPTEAELTQVYDILSDDYIRPLTDQVFVEAPQSIIYTIDVDWWLRTSDARFGYIIEDAVEKAYQDFITWQTTKIGRDINPSRLNQMLVDTGAKRTVIRYPYFTVLTPRQIATIDLDNSHLNYMGLEDE